MPSLLLSCVDDSKTNPETKALACDQARMSVGRRRRRSVVIVGFILPLIFEMDYFLNVL